MKIKSVQSSPNWSSPSCGAGLCPKPTLWHPPRRVLVDAVLSSGGPICAWRPPAGAQLTLGLLPRECHWELTTGSSSSERRDFSEDGGRFWQVWPRASDTGWGTLPVASAQLTGSIAVPGGHSCLPAPPRPDGRSVDSASAPWPLCTLPQGFCGALWSLLGARGRISPVRASAARLAGSPRLSLVQRTVSQALGGCCANQR